ncbi:baseplate J/gp47 family protein [Halodesulfovibrio aestuarii]|uniref:baseplate J/gp47 family protein n=1 Tax=Halodesulfovibrio aestuarii TaxID=126333 RepID=UPI000422AE85
MAESNKIFTAMLQDAGVPVTEEAMQQRWNEINSEQGGLIQNNSKWSPFWRLITAIVTEPCKQLVKLLIEHALPNVFLRYASSTWLDLYAWGVDVERKAGVKAQGQLVVTRTVSTGELFIPAGTVVESPPINGYVYTLVCSTDVTIADGQLTGLLPVVAEQIGKAYNLGPSYYSILPVAIAGVASVTNNADWLLVAGADTEEDEPLRLRCRNQFSAVGQYHHDAAYTAEISTFAGIRPDYLFFEYDAPRGAGSANCYVMIETGVPTQEFVDTINTHVRDTGNHGHGDDLRCFPVQTTAVPLTVTVHPVPHLSEEKREALRAGVENMVRCAFRENTNYTVSKTWPLGRFSFSRLSDELHGQFLDLRSVEFSQDDIVSELTLPVLSALTVELGAE